MTIPTVGRIVHYVMSSEHPRASGEIRPAVIVRRWSDDPEGAVQLQVFTDGGNDGNECASGVVWKTSVRHDEGKAPGTWHWPPRV